MTDLPAIYSRPNGIRPAAPRSVLSVHSITVAGNRRESLQRRPLHLVGWSRHVHTQTYDEGGRLVESTAHPTLDICM
jgi:YD repeat-containing protein